MTKLSKAAEKYNKMGLWIFPLMERSKKPHAETRGFLDASNDPAIVKKWWTDGPNDNIGLACRASKVIGIDADLDPTKGFDGPADWAGVVKEYHINDKTWTNLTPRGGLHILYHVPENLTINPPRYLLGKESLEIKWNGYLLLPPSIHPDIKTEYTWEVSHHPTETTLLPIPDNLLRLLTDPKDIPLYQQYKITEVTPGVRDNYFNSLCGYWWKAGIVKDAESFIAKCKEYNDKMPNPFTDKELKKVIESGMKYEKDAIKGKKTKVPILSDIELAERLKKQYGDHVCYHPLKGKDGAWMVFDGTKWVEDTAGQIALMAFDIMKDLDPQHHSHAKIRNLLAEAQPRMAVEPARFDSNPMLLNILNGTIDLQTGELKPHNSKDLITLQADVTFDKDASCPQWQSFLTEIFRRDEQLIDYVQDLIGYSLTGITSEQTYFMAHGQLAGNGKSTFFTVIRTMLGTYAGHTKVDSILKTKNPRLPDDVALWEKLRFLTTSEVPEGRALNEALIKDLTGGEPINARPLFSKWFTFKPELKLWIPGNVRPKTSSNRGIMRRTKSIPFNYVIPDEKINKFKDRELITELPGILNWAINGCLRWQNIGFEEPLTVIQSTEEFKDEMNIIGNFFNDCCVKDDSWDTPRGDLYPLYQNWHRKNVGDNRILNGIDFGVALRELGIDKARKTDPSTKQKVTVYLNVRIAEEAERQYAGHIAGHNAPSDDLGL